MSLELKQSMVDGGLWAAGGRLVAIGAAFVLNVALARTLSPADYGVYFVVLITMVILATVATVGMDQVVVRFVAAHKAMGDWAGVRAVVVRCLAVVLATTALVCLVFHLLTPWFFTEVVKMPAAIALGGLMLLWLFFSTLQRQLAETFRGLNDIRCATLFGGLRNNGILISLINCAVALVLWATGTMTLAAVFVMTVCSSLLVVIVAAWTLWHRLRATDRGPRPAAAATSWSTATALHEGWPLLLVGMIGVLRGPSNGWLAAVFDSAEHVALYAVAQRFVLLASTPLTIVNALLPPVVADLYARGATRRLENVVQAVGGLASLPCVVILALIVLAGRPVLGLLFGDHYQDAYPLLVVLCVGQVANIVTGSWQIVLPMTGHRQQMLRVSTLATVIQLGCSIVGGYAAGVIGVALGASVGTIVGNALGVLTVHRHLSIWTLISVRRTVLMEAVALLAKRMSALRPARARGG